MTDKGQPHEKDQVRYRSMSLAFEPPKDGTRADDTRIPVAISSESPVERYDWFTDERYMEVLDHSPESVDLSYAKDGMPFLLDHDSRVQVGILEDVRVEDGKVRAVIRMGNHPDAAWVEKDIRAGVRKKVSVGYRLGEYRVEKDEFEGLPVRRYRWKPIEGSSVPIPADYEGSGIGRSKSNPVTDALAKAAKDGINIPIRFTFEDPKREEGTDVGPCANDGCGHDYAAHKDGGMACQAEGCVCPAYVQKAAESLEKQVTLPAPKAKERSMSEIVPGSDAAPAHKPGSVAVSLEDQRKEMADITRLGNEHGMADKVPDWLQRGLTLERVKSEIFDAKVRGATAITPAGHLGMSERDGLKYNFLSAIQNKLAKSWEDRGGHEKEVSDAVAKRLGRSTGGFFIPLDMPVLHRVAVTGNVAATSSLGGAGVQTSVLSLIDLLRNKMLVRSLGATVLSGLTGNITFPRHIVANTMAWEGENPATAHANTAATLDNVALSPKTAMASSAYSRQLLIQESFDVSAFIQNDLATVLALGLDLAALDGTGSSNQPTGIMRQTGVTVITHTGANGGVPTWADMVSYETNVATNNADIGNIAWVTTPGLRGKLKTVLKTTTAGSTFIWESDQSINGYAAHATAQMPSNFTFGTSTTIAHGVAFGVWSELLIGEWGGALEVVIDPYTSAKQGMVEITQMILADIAVKHPKAFAITKSALLA